jgi:hypothetical protein
VAPRTRTTEQHAISAIFWALLIAGTAAYLAWPLVAPLWLMVAD